MNGIVVGNKKKGWSQSRQKDGQNMKRWRNAKLNSSYTTTKTFVLQYSSTLGVGEAGKTMLDPYSVLRQCTQFFLGALIIYFSILGLLIAFPPLQTHAVYLHRVTLTWFKDLNVPEQFGFLRNQVTVFRIRTEDGEQLHAWHILPLGIYLKHQEGLLQDESHSRQDVTEARSFALLKEDPEARLILNFHGTAGCIASGWRPESYRNLSSTAPNKIHVLAFDYRGYGLSTGIPSEEGLLKDALAVVRWATDVAGVPPSRILIYGQSLGTAVAIAIVQKLAAQVPAVSFAGLVLTASFSDTAALTATYRIGGVIPVLSPLASLPPLFEFFSSFLTSTWLSKDRIATFVGAREAPKNGGPYHITFLHAEDDDCILYRHSDVLYWHAVSTATSKSPSFKVFEEEKGKKKIFMGKAGWAVEHRSQRGVIRQEMLKYGLHYKIMAYPVSASAVLRAFQFSDPSFGAVSFAST